jgi:uncharacterized membrane protein
MRGAALTLGLSSLALALFPQFRPFFFFDPTHPMETMDAAAPAVASGVWRFAHYLALIGFVLLLCALPALHARLAAAGVEARSRRAMVLCILGVALVLPTLGVELYAMPAIGRIYLAGSVSIAPAVSLIYIGGATLVMLLGLLLLAIGAIVLATAIARSRALPKWAAIVYAIGLAAWCPLFPPVLRVVDGILIGVGGIALAWALRRPARPPEAGGFHPEVPGAPHPALSPEGRG